MFLKSPHPASIFPRVACMPKQRNRNGLTWLEVLVIICICAVLLGLLIPAILAVRENSRKQTCIDNLRKIGEGMHSYHDAKHYFPPSADLRSDGLKKEAGGWSFLFRILPYMEDETSYCSGPPDIVVSIAVGQPSTIDPLTGDGASSSFAVRTARDTSIPEFLCPANPNPTFEFPGYGKIDAQGRRAFTNYKAMGASCLESLKLCVDPGSPPPYGKKEKHPDGAIFPSDKGTRISDIADGTAYTIMVAETMDDTKSSWIAGSDVTLVGMPKAEYYQEWHGSFWIPLDYTGGYYEYAGPAIRAMRTYTAFDFRPGYSDAGTYSSGVGRTPSYGPSSNHPGIVNHSYCDGSVKSMRKDVDYAAYFIFITRDNHDPSRGDEP